MAVEVTQNKDIFVAKKCTLGKGIDSTIQREEPMSKRSGVEIFSETLILTSS